MHTGMQELTAYPLFFAQEVSEQRLILDFHLLLVLNTEPPSSELMGLKLKSFNK